MEHYKSWKELNIKKHHFKIFAYLYTYVLLSLSKETT